MFQPSTFYITSLKAYNSLLISLIGIQTHQLSKMWTVLSYKFCVVLVFFPSFVPYCWDGLLRWLAEMDYWDEQCTGIFFFHLTATNWKAIVSLTNDLPWLDQLKKVEIKGIFTVCITVSSFQACSPYECYLRCEQNNRLLQKDFPFKTTTILSSGRWSAYFLISSWKIKSLSNT